MMSQEEFEDTKEIIRIRKLEKNRQHNGQKKKYKRTNNNQTMSCQKTLETTERKLTAINCNKKNLILISLFDWMSPEMEARGRRPPMSHFLHANCVDF